MKFSSVVSNLWFHFHGLVKWCGGNVNRLFTGGVDSIVHMYDIQQLKEVGMREGYNPARPNEEYYHNSKKNGEIMDLLPIPELGLLASAGFDKKICLWRMDSL